MSNSLNLRSAVSLLLLSSTVYATDWVGVDDFEKHQEGQAVTAQPAWQVLPGFETATIALDENHSYVSQISPGQALCTSIKLNKLAIPEGATGTIFLKFRTLKDSRYWGGVFGMASKPVASEQELNVGWTLGTPADGSRPAATFAVLGDSEAGVLVKNRGRMNEAYGFAPEIKPGVWYSLWVTIDNSRDEISLFIQGGDFEKRTQLTNYQNSKQSAFSFRTASASDLTHFVIINPTDPDVTHNPRTIQVDEINYFVQPAPSALAGNQ